MGARYEIHVVENETEEYPFLLVDEFTGEVVDAFRNGKMVSDRLADYRGEYRQDEYGGN